MRYFSPAKLNLFLHITARRDDGYHDLQSVFCPLDFGDFLTIKSAPECGMPLTLTGADNLTDTLSDNLIFKAVQTLSMRYPDKACPVSIHLEKHIPTGAGLGGGSSNAATTLIALNELWSLSLGEDELIKIGLTLGADVPFFIFAHIHRTGAIVEGVGERLTAIDLPDTRFLLLLPDSHISTAQFFAKPDLKRDCDVISHQTLCDMDLYRLPASMGNVFEPIAIKASPNVATALTYLHSLERHTQTVARMTGTGSVVFLPLGEMGDDVLMQAMAHAPCPAVLTKLWS